LLRRPAGAAGDHALTAGYRPTPRVLRRRADDMREAWAAETWRDAPAARVRGVQWGRWGAIIRRLPCPRCRAGAVASDLSPATLHRSMDFDLPESVHNLRQRARQFAETECAPLSRRM